MASKIKPISASELPVESRDFVAVSLEHVAQMLEKGLRSNFADAVVKVVDCPDLTRSPFGLSTPGLCGQARILDIGGVPNLVPTPKLEKLYDLKDFPGLVDFHYPTQDSVALMIGAGAAPWTLLERNAELMSNLSLEKDGTVKSQNSYLSRTFDDNPEHGLVKLPDDETKSSLLLNLLMSQGLPGKVLEIRAIKRTGPDNFVSCMRKTLEAGMEGFIGLGGVFCAQKGKLKIHVMPKFSEAPLITNEDVDSWLKFFEVHAPFTNFSVFVNRDPGLDLRVEHTHGYNIKDGEGGHYHCDTTPEEVEYLGYFAVAEKCYRIDRPTATHQIGRD